LSTKTFLKSKKDLGLLQKLRKQGKHAESPVCGISIILILHT